MRIFLFFILTNLSYKSEVSAQSSSIYSIKLPSIDGGDSISISNFQGKKILLVNTASLNEVAQQYNSLEQLYQHFKDSNLVIIACPSNSFDREPGSNDEIFRLISSKYSPHFVLSGKVEVVGENAHPLYKWIGSKELNGVMNGKIKGDFTKFLINAQGQIIGFYSTIIDPGDAVIINAIRNN